MRRLVHRLKDAGLDVPHGDMWGRKEGEGVGEEHKKLLVRRVCVCDADRKRSTKRQWSWACGKEVQVAWEKEAEEPEGRRRR